jgi:hypothetical protein
MDIDLTHPEILTIEQLQKVKQKKIFVFFLIGDFFISLLDLI